MCPSRRPLTATLSVVLAACSLFLPHIRCAAEEKEAPPPAPAPTADKLAAAEKAVRDEFKAQYEKKQPEAQAALAKELLDRAAQAQQEPAVCYVLHREAADLYAAASDAPAAFGALDALARRFEVPVLDLKMTVWQEAWRKARNPAEYERAFKAGLELLDALRSGARFDPAEKLAFTLRGHQPSLKDPYLKDQAQADLSTTKTAECSRMAMAFRRLEAVPTDPEASLAVGRFWVVTRDNWTRALPLFAQCPNPLLANAARRELAKPREPLAKMQSAEAWWTAVGKETGAFKAALLAHATEQYNEVLPELTGAQKTTVEERLATALAARVTTCPPAYRPGLLRTTKLTFRRAPFAVSVNAVGRLAVAVNGDGCASVDVESGQVLKEVPCEVRGPFACSRDGRRLAVGAGNPAPEVRVYDVLTGVLLERISKPELGPVGLAFNRSEEVVAVYSAFPTIKFQVMNTRTGKVLFTCNYRADLAVLNPDLSLLAIGRGGNNGAVFDGNTGAVKMPNYNVGADVRGFSCDGRLLLVNGGGFHPGKWIGIYEVATGKLVRQIALEVDLQAIDLLSAEFLPDKRRVAAVCGDGAVRIWDFIADKVVLKIDLPGKPKCLALSADGRFLVTGNEDKTLHLYGLPK